MDLTASLRWLAEVVVAVLGRPFLFERFFSDWRMASTIWMGGELLCAAAATQCCTHATLAATRTVLHNRS